MQSIMLCQNTKMPMNHRLMVVVYWWQVVLLPHCHVVWCASHLRQGHCECAGPIASNLCLHTGWWVWLDQQAVWYLLAQYRAAVSFAGLHLLQQILDCLRNQWHRAVQMQFTISKWQWFQFIFAYHRWWWTWGLSGFCRQCQRHTISCMVPAWYRLQ